jgi:hypothetical protein
MDHHNRFYHGSPPLSEAPRPQAGASRERNTVLIVPLDPAYKAGLAGHLPVIGFGLSALIFTLCRWSLPSLIFNSAFRNLKIEMFRYNLISYLFVYVSGNLLLPYLPVSPSPYLLISLSPHLPISPSRYLSFAMANFLWMPLTNSVDLTSGSSTYSLKN